MPPMRTSVTTTCGRKRGITARGLPAVFGGLDRASPRAAGGSPAAGAASRRRRRRECAPSSTHCVQRPASLSLLLICVSSRLQRLELLLQLGALGALRVELLARTSPGVPRARGVAAPPRSADGEFARESRFLRTSAVRAARLAEQHLSDWAFGGIRWVLDRTARAGKLRASDRRTPRALTRAAAQGAGCAPVSRQRFKPRLLGQQRRFVLLLQRHARSRSDPLQERGTAPPQVVFPAGGGGLE